MSQRLLIITADNCPGCHVFKKNYYHDFIAKLKKYGISYQEINIPRMDDQVALSKALSVYHPKLIHYLKFYPSFMLIDENTLKKELPKVEVYNVAIKGYNNNNLPITEMIDRILPNVKQLFEWLSQKLNIENEKKPVLVKNGHSIKIKAPDTSKTEFKEEVHFSFYNEDEEEEYTLISI